MNHATRIALVLFTTSLLAPGARAGDPVAALPEGAQVVGYFDLAAWRSSAAMQALDAETMGANFGLDSSLFEGLGDEGRFDRLAIGGFPIAGGTDMDLAMIMEGAWDQAAMAKAFLESGAVEVAVGGKSAYRMPKDEDGEVFVASFLGEGRLALSSWDLAERVRAGGGPLSAALTKEIAALPPSLSAWVLVADPLKAGASSGIDTGAAAGFAAGMRSLGLWARASEKLEVGATALARDAQQAAQLGMLLQLGLGMAVPQGGEWSDVLSTLRFDTSGDRVSLGLELGPEQVRRLAGQLSSTTAAAVGR